MPNAPLLLCMIALKHFIQSTQLSSFPTKSSNNFVKLLKLLLSMPDKLSIVPLHSMFCPNFNTVKLKPHTKTEPKIQIRSHTSQSVELHTVNAHRSEFTESTRSDFKSPGFIYLKKLVLTVFSFCQSVSEKSAANSALNSLTSNVDFRGK